MADIVLFGATGFTGRLVAEALQARGLPFAVAGRSRARVRALAEQLGVPYRVADAEQPRTLGDLVAGVRVLVNCAGPFLRFGEPVVQAAIEHGAHYLDTTGEQTWMKRILDRYDGAALRQGVTVINAAAFEYAVGDWLAPLTAAKLGEAMLPLDSLSVGYSLAGGGITQGTARSLWEMLGERGWSYEGGRWRQRPVGWTRRTMHFPHGDREVLWVPFGETLTVPRHQAVRTVLTFVRLTRRLATLLPLVGQGGSLLQRTLRPLAERYIARQPEGPTPAQRERARFTLVAEALRGGEQAQATATGADPYGLTGRIAALAAEQLLTQPAPRGVRAPAALPLAPAEALARVGVAVE